MRLNGLLTGFTCGAGALVAHSLAGGRVDLLTAALAVVVPVALARLLVGRRLTWYGAGLVAAASQATLHLVFITSCASEVGCLLSPAQMATAHFLAAAFSVLCALGGERAVLRAIQLVAASLGVPRFEISLPLNTESIPALVPASSYSSQWSGSVAPARGPPAR